MGSTSVENQGGVNDVRALPVLDDGCGCIVPCWCWMRGADAREEAVQIGGGSVTSLFCCSCISEWGVDESRLWWRCTGSCGWHGCKHGVVVSGVMDVTVQKEMVGL